MSDETKHEPERDDDALAGGADGDEGAHLDDVDVRELLRAALDPPRTTVPPNILRGVQKKLRARSRGKFYGDGWSNSKSPRSTYLVTSALMLALILLVFFVLIPWGGSLVGP